jgi:hypothetical protein
MLLFTLVTISIAAPSFPVVIHAEVCADLSVPPCDTPELSYPFDLILESSGEGLFSDVVYGDEIGLSWSFGGGVITLEMTDYPYAVLRARPSGGGCFEGVWDGDNPYIGVYRLFWAGCL